MRILQPFIVAALVASLTPPLNAVQAQPDAPSCAVNATEVLRLPEPNSEQRR